MTIPLKTTEENFEEICQLCETEFQNPEQTYIGVTITFSYGGGLILIFRKDWILLTKEEKLDHLITLITSLSEAIFLNPPESPDHAQSLH